MALVLALDQDQVALVLRATQLLQVDHPAALQEDHLSKKKKRNLRMKHADLDQSILLMVFS